MILTRLRSAAILLASALLLACTPPNGGRQPGAGRDGGGADAEGPGGSGGSGGGSGGWGGTGGWGGFDSGTDGPAGDGRPDAAGWDGAGSTCGEVTMSLPHKRKTPDVLIVFDRSGSMSDPFGTGTKFTVEAEILKEVVTRFTASIRFGYSQFPSQAPGFDCSADPVSVLLGQNNAVDIAAAIDGAAEPSGNTPQAGALQEAFAYYSTIDDKVEQRYVLLSTDGQPTCDISGTRSSETVGCADALVVVSRLVALGVKVIVLGVGDVGGSTQNCLEELGARGGAPRPDGPPYYYPASDPTELQKQLQEIVGEVVKPTCFLDLTSQPPDPDKVQVFFDGVEVPHDPTGQHGWMWSERGTQIVFIGEQCARLEGFMVKDISLRYGCRPCGGTVSCQDAGTGPD